MISVKPKMFNDKMDEKHLVRVKPTRERVWNIIGCLLLIPCFLALLMGKFYPMTLDLLVAIFLAEYNRRENQRRRDKANTSPLLPPPARLSTALPLLNGQRHQFPSVAAVVGYREDPVIFEKALRSYESARGCVFVLVSVDGEDKKDLEMVSVFNKVFPKRSAVSHVCEPMGEVALRIYQQKVGERKTRNLEPRLNYCRRFAMDYCCQLARQTLSDHRVKISRGSNIHRLCLYQRHMHKKGVMFTSFIFSMVICQMLDIDFLWSSDSDTYVFPESLEQTIATIAGDESIGGASSSLLVHNKDDNVCTKLGSAIYWSELYITRSSPASLGSSDCQSGPSAAFRVELLRGILLPWYNQKVWGKCMVINEDRHLTTSLIARGWNIAFASDVLAGTETPETVARWIGQQVRWARAAHIESFQQPLIYVLSHPVFFWSALKREVTPLVAFAGVIVYVSTSCRPQIFSINDMLLRVAISFCYNCARNPDRNLGDARRWALPALLFYNIPLPAIQVWSLVTVLDQGWVTSMRARVEKASAIAFMRKLYEGMFLVIWMGIVGAAVGKAIFEFAKTHQIQTHMPTGSAMLISGLTSCLVTWYIMIGKP